MAGTANNTDGTQRGGKPTPIITFGHSKDLARWEASWEHREPVRKSLDEIRQAFLWSDTRTVTKTGTVSLHSNTYEVDPVLAGTKVELVYDPFDLHGQITVNSHLGVPAGTAKALQITRHVHAKATNAVKDADTSAVNLSSGINYLDLVAVRHRESLTGAPISFADIQALSGNNNQDEVATA